MTDESASALWWYIRRSLEALRYEGLHIFLWRTLTQCLSPLGTVQPWTFYRRDLTKPIAEVSSAAEVLVALAGDADVGQLAALVSRRYGPMAIGPYKTLGIEPTIRHRLQRGLKCFVARVGPEIVHYNWLAFRCDESLGDTGGCIVLQNGEAYCTDAYTADSWRGKGIHTVVLRQMLVHAKEAGCHSVYTDVGSDNKSSWKTHERLGWEVCGTAVDFTPRRARTSWRWHVRGGPGPFAATRSILVRLRDSSS